jgi:hypothetical protein
MMMNKQAPLLILLPLVVAACSHAPRPDVNPDWIAGSSAKYPPAHFLTGEGEAGSLAVARDRARADLAKTFSVKVSEHSEDVASYQKSGAGATDNTLDVSRRIATQTTKLLHGVRIADTWRDPATQTYYALAVLPRTKAAAALREQIAELDAATRGWLERARNSGDLVAKITAASRAVGAQTKRARLQNELRVVDITGADSAPPWNLGQLRADQAALLARLNVTAAARGQSAGKLETLLQGALSKAGFTVRRDAPFAVTATLDYDTLPPREGWYWITGTLTVALDGVDEAHGAKRWPLKVSATDPALARQRLMDQVAHKLHKDVRAAVLRFAGERRAGE